MTQAHQTAILIPLLFGSSAIICTIVIHRMALIAGVNFFRRDRRLGRAGLIFWKDVAVVTLTMTIALTAHLIEIALWAILFLLCGEFSEFGAACYRSAVNYHDSRLWRRSHVGRVEDTGAGGSCRRNANVRYF